MPTTNKKHIVLDNMTEDDILKLRICDLPLAIEGTWLEECVQQLYSELEQRGIPFKPVCYLADEWLTPEGESVIGIPFYLAHPVLTRLEKKMMLEAEGETKPWCMKLLRHETGHALCYAYNLNRKRGFRKIFGPPSQEYSDTYRYRPYSKSYVRHLEGFYAQYHPDEDFVETFAVWLTPDLDWQKQYAGWRALKKLNYIDAIMERVKKTTLVARKNRKLWHYKTVKSTLANFYKRKRHLRAEDLPDFHDNNLKRIFPFTAHDMKEAPLAWDILKKYRKEIIHQVSLWTGERRHVIHDLLKDIIKRCRELKLVSSDAESLTVLRVTSYVTTLIMNYIYTGWYRGDKKKRKK